MGSRRWRAGAAGAALACALVAALPPGSPLWLALARGTSVVAALVFLAAVVHMPSEVRAVWWGLWVFQCLTIAGDIVYDALRYGLGVEPFPSAADGLYLASYGAILAALVVLVNKRFPGRDREAWIDTAIMTVAAMTAVGTFIILPMVDHAGGRDWGTWIALSYPVMDLVILSTLIRLVVGGGRINPALALLVASVGATLTADLVFGGLVESGAVEAAGGWIDATFLAAVVLLTLAVTAPGAARITQPRVEDPPGMTATRLAGLTLGVLTPPALLACVSWTAGNPPIRMLALASILVVLLGLWRIVILSVKVEGQSAQLARQARTDALTDLPNRRTWDFELQRLSEQATLAGLPMTVAVLDLDHFKVVNDTLGHPAADQVLRACARAWEAEVGGGHFLARYGGEEFAIAMPGVPLGPAIAALERVRLATPDPMTVSIGCAEHAGDESILESVARADRALYRAKQCGRDRVVADDRWALPDQIPDPARNAAGLAQQPGAAAEVIPG